MVTIRVIADWNNNGVFDSTEDISTDVRRLSWTRGREAEQGETPAGTLTVELKDPVGDYSPHNSGSKWGGSNVTLNRELLAQAIYGGTTYGLFRGRIQSIKPQITAEEQRASIFCIDGMDELTRKIFSIPVDGPTSGGVAIGGGPISISVGTTAGSTLGAIHRILTGSSWASTRRLITEQGSTLSWWSQYNISAKAALDELERHDRGSIIFVNSSGNIQFFSSTHFAGSTFAARFDSSDIKAWDYDFNSRNLYNAAQITVHGRLALLTDTDVGHVLTTSLPDLTTGNGSTFWITIPFSQAPAVSIFTPQIGQNATGGGVTQLALVSTGGTTLATGLSSIFCTSLGGSAIRCFINNLDTSPARIQAPEGATSTTICLWVRATPLTDDPFTSSNFDSTSVSIFKRRTFSADYPFLDQSSNAQAIAARIVSQNKQPKADFARMSLESASTYLVTQILTREIGDKIRVTVAELGITDRDYLIYQAEWEAIPGNALGLGAHLSVVWGGLVESSGNSTALDFSTSGQVHIAGVSGGIQSQGSTLTVGWADAVEQYDNDSMFPGRVGGWGALGFSLKAPGTYFVYASLSAKSQIAGANDSISIGYHLRVTDTDEVAFVTGNPQLLFKNFVVVSVSGNVVVASTTPSVDIAITGVAAVSSETNVQFTNVSSVFEAHLLQ